MPTRLTSIIVGLIVALGFSAMGFFIGDGLRNIRTTSRYVNVRGLSEREVSADTVKLTIKIEHNGNDSATLFPQIGDTQKQVVAFLKEEGLKDDEIENGQWTTTHTSAAELKDDPKLPRITLAGTITVTSHNIAAAQSAYQKINDLRVKTSGSVTDAEVTYSFTGLAPLRAEMIAAATKDARNAALQFAQDSGSRVGSIRNASQGGFQILTPGQEFDDPKSVRKNVRVVTTVDYELKD